ncbi:MAG: sulfate reduction electron transfer complex DsrMKJOP subunit DsrM [Thermodesulfovibrionales bacterium]|jgi:nitrate reductase gamma subunit|nr:sulfate reduction electron transfer complex DsrMKJOP subunit DsrM [Thermodesulfovibrionales bacterium]
MKILFPFFAVILLVLLAVVGVKGANLHFLFGVVVPYAAVFTFIIGVIYRVLKWAKSPVPFSIATTCGQQKTLPWIKQDKLENPSSTLHVIGRMALEVLLFRSLFRNLKGELKDSSRLIYGSDKWLWLAGIAFHYSFLIVLLRHIRLFAEPTPSYLHLLETFDGFLQIGIPRLFMTGVILLAAVTFLFLRRLYIPQVRYISLAADYFPLFLIIGIATTGILMRYFFKTDVVGVKELTMGLVSLSPVIPEGVGAIFYVHLLLVSTLFAYFPFSKLMHMGGVFLSPTRNLTANSREYRRINPWNYPVKVHTYEEYEEEFRDKMKMAEIPVEKE